MINDDAQSADALLRENAELRAEVAHLQADLDGLRDQLLQAHRAIEAERAARNQYEIIVHAARAVCHNNAPANITRLAAAIDHYDAKMEGREV